MNNTNRTKYDSNEIILYESYAELKLYDKFGKYKNSCMIDISDIEKIKKHKWYLDSCGYPRTKYKNEKNENIYIRLHRYLLNPPIDMDVDHINKNKLDNRRINLRVCTHEQNSKNRKIAINNSTGIIGVSKTKSNLYCVMIENSALKYRKHYKDKELAIIQRLIWELQFFGEFSPQIELIKSNYKPLLGYFQVKDKMKFTDDIELIKNICDELNTNPHCPCLLNKTSDTTICPCLPCRNIQKCCCGLYVPINNKKDD